MLRICEEEEEEEAAAAAAAEEEEEQAEKKKQQQQLLLQLSNRKVRNFAMALRARKVSGAFEKQARKHSSCILPL